ncbi:unnamed protein product (macronuclear) [Paramecium tetraurelia]|uniref:non-specific serine/threonine protein kinase n=1 Tax=Paramecium tetraurelia TaxID=5888 RepID=A0BKC0_PARTE|nr:uncharacterized protein GSPATT00029618001 [Paramecium tetraurelia]CAK58987.1 unnamed protein product [Paramecium tetraurelia]|eukprot:XP_001426385.1 hypothetical protein (macronuclear) [Paramecium tetraurelia strain d4-2]
MNYNSYQSYKPYSRNQQQTYHNNQILSYVEQVLQKSRTNYTQHKIPESNLKSNSNLQNINTDPDGKAILNSPKITPQELKIAQKQDTTPIKTIPLHQSQQNIDRQPLIPLIPLMQNLKEQFKQKQAFQQQSPPKKTEERFKNFKIIKKLGDGKYSEVFLARHLQTGFLVALKVIQKKQMIEEIMEAQLAWEIKIQYLLDHPNITKLYTFFQTQTEIVLVLEYCSHGQLLGLLQKQQNQRFQEKEASNYVHQITFALMYIHNNDVIHRDIKPDNILLSFGQAKIADFSFCVYSPHAYRQTQCGTIIYASPEILEGDMYDKKSDIWGLGVLTYELCFGKPPWKEHQQELMKTACFLIPSSASKELREFIESLVKRLSRERLTAKQAYNHSWLQQTQQALPQFIQQNVTIFN